MAADDVAELRARMARGMTEGVIRAGEDLLGEGQRRAPKEEGTLRASGALTIIVNGSRYEGAGARAEAMAAAAAAARAGAALEVTAEVSFNTVYAARQHEEMDWHHEDGEAKYLERPLRERADRYNRVIGASAARGL